MTVDEIKTLVASLPLSEEGMREAAAIVEEAVAAGALEEAKRERLLAILDAEAEAHTASGELLDEEADIMEAMVANIAKTLEKEA